MLKWHCPFKGIIPPSLKLSYMCVSKNLARFTGHVDCFSSRNIAYFKRYHSLTFQFIRGFVMSFNDNHYIMLFRYIYGARILLVSLFKDTFKSSVVLAAFGSEVSDVTGPASIVKRTGLDQGPLAESKFGFFIAPLTDIILDEIFWSFKSRRKTWLSQLKTDICGIVQASSVNKLCRKCWYNF